MGLCLSKPAAQATAAGQVVKLANSAEPPHQAAAQPQPHEPAAAAKAAPLDAVPAAGAAADAAAGDAGDASCGLKAYAGAPAPVCELARIKHLHSLNILYTPPEQRFDDITRLCSLVFKVPIALVSLVDSPVQWFKSAQGLGAVDRTPRNTSFCAWTLLPTYPEALVVENALQDDRFKDNPLVVEAPFIRFYAGCPLVCSNGMRLGSLCIIDDKPREFDANSCNLLANMAEMVVRELEKDSMLEQQQRQTEQRQLLRAINCFGEAIMLVEVDASREEPWAVMFANEAWEGSVGHTRPTDGQRLPFWQVFQLPPNSRSSSEGWVAAACSSAIRAQQNFELLLAPVCGGGGVLQAQFRCAANTGLDGNMLPIGIPNFLPTYDEQGAAAGDAGGRAFYFATLRTPPPHLLQQQHHHNSGGSSSRPNSWQQQQGSSGNASHEGPRPPGRTSTFSLLSGLNEPFPDIKLGPLLGKGAFGRVYRATWQGRMVAVKIIEYTQEVGQEGPLEGLLSQQVQHPNVVTTYKHAMRTMDMVVDDGDDTCSTSTGGPDGYTPSSSSTTPHGTGSFVSPGPPRPRRQLQEAWLILEFCNRGCVSDAVEKGWFRATPRRDRGGAAPAPTAERPGDRSSGRGAAGAYVPNVPAILATAREMAAALSYLHHRNMLHGDLTGNNVLLTAAPEEARGFMAKVSDFGLSRLVSNDTPVIETRTYGTVTHMPPELLLYGHMSKAVDVYSWGVIVWEMASGRRPFAGLSHSQVLHAIGLGRSLELPCDIPPALTKLLAACLSREPENRPQFMQVLDTLVDLEAQL